MLSDQTFANVSSGTFTRRHRKWIILVVALLLITTQFLYSRQYLVQQTVERIHTSDEKVEESPLNQSSETSSNQTLESTQSNQTLEASSNETSIQHGREPPPYTHGMRKLDGSWYTRTLVLGHMQREDVGWINETELNVNTTIYIMDDPEAEHRVPENKGHEAMAYLTYIIDHYDNLSDTTLFFHAHPEAWHNNVLLDLLSVPTIQRLSSARVEREGYMNSRCHHDPGCPNWLHIDQPSWLLDKGKKGEEEFFTSELWHELHGPDEPIPPSVSQPCCAQFAVSRDRIRSNPIERYEHIRGWLLNTTLLDGYSGRVMEYTWQMLFAHTPEFCPPQNECYCDGYGICFGGDRELEDWLELKKLHEDLQRDQRFYHRAGHDKNSEAARALAAKFENVTRELHELKDAAFERGKDPENRAKEAGRTWHPGDGF